MVLGLCMTLISHRRVIDAKRDIAGDSELIFAIQQNEAGVQREQSREDEAYSVIADKMQDEAKKSYENEVADISKNINSINDAITGASGERKKDLERQFAQWDAKRTDAYTHYQDRLRALERIDSAKRRNIEEQNKAKLAQLNCEEKRIGMKKEKDEETFTMAKEQYAKYQQLAAEESKEAAPRFGAQA